ncbi:hypothetical protein [Symmachiella dynata]|uniref:hypothetical protein n=1 Tax=Symmachiella dynata TaxID=2527995 RepID=UPI0030EE5E9A
MNPRTESDSRLIASQWAAELLDADQTCRFIVVRYERRSSGGKCYRKDLHAADRALFAACKEGDLPVAAAIVQSLSHYDDSGFAFADTVETLTEALIPRVQARQDCYDLADWGGGGAVLTVWSD